MKKQGEPGGTCEQQPLVGIGGVGEKREKRLESADPRPVGIGGGGGVHDNAVRAFDGLRLGGEVEPGRMAHRSPGHLSRQLAPLGQARGLA